MPWRDQRVPAGLILTVGFVLGLVPGCGRDPTVELASALADNLPVEDRPTHVINGYWCAPDLEECVPGHQRPSYSLIDASPLINALASRAGLVIVQPNDVEPLACTWSPTDGLLEGAYAQLPRPPMVNGNTAMIHLFVGCNAQEEVVEARYVYRFERRNGRWTAVSKELESVT
mgnify:CR=1 FL=1